MTTEAELKATADPQILSDLVLANRILYALSTTYVKVGRRTEAEALLAEAAVLARQHLGQHPDMAKIVEDYSTLLSNSGKTKEANELRGEAKRARVSNGLVINAHNPF